MNELYIYLIAINEVVKLLFPIAIYIYDWINDNKIKGYVQYRLL